MTDARQLFAYAFYGLAVAVLVVEQVHSFRTIRRLREKYPGVKRQWWFQWNVPQGKEAQQDPAYRRMQRLHWLYWLLFLGCLFAAQYTMRLSGREAPAWIGWLRL